MRPWLLATVVEEIRAKEELLGSLKQANVYILWKSVRHAFGEPRPLGIIQRRFSWDQFASNHQLYSSSKLI